MGAPQDFARAGRLLQATDFQRVFDAPDRRVSRPGLLVLAANSPSGRPRLGMVISKKSIPKANRRNRVKRLIRESFRRMACDLPHVDIVVLSRPAIDGIDNQAVATLLAGVWRELSS